MSTLLGYRIFVAVVESGTVTQAAHQLNYTAPAISKQVTQLEASLKVQLFFRSHKSLTLTPEGKVFYQKCKDILALVAQAEDEILQEQDAVSGKIAITLSKSLARSSLFDHFANFQSRYPEINFDIHFSDTVENLHQEQFDFAFRLGKLEDTSHLRVIPLGYVQLIACATPQYLSKFGQPKSFSDLNLGRWAFSVPASPSTELRKFIKREKLNIEEKRSHRSNDIEGVYQMVRANLGIGFLLDVNVQKELEEGSLIDVFSETPILKKRMYLLSKKTEWQSQKQKAFKSHIKASYNQKTV